MSRWNFEHSLLRLYPVINFLRLSRCSNLVPIVLGGREPGPELFGQSRVLLVWNRLIFPNGRSIVLERQPGADVEGYAGLQDGVDYHWWDLAKAAGLSTLLSVGAELATNDDDRLIQAIRNGGQDTINDAGQQIIRRQLNVPPTLTIRPGFPVRVIVTRDLVLEPYGG